MGSNSGATYTTTINGTEEVAYTSETLTGTVVTGGRDFIEIVIRNSGEDVRFLRLENDDGDVYVADSCAMDSYPQGWITDYVYDGLLAYSGVAYAVDVNNAAICDGPFADYRLYKVQDITFNGGTHAAVVEWILDKN